MQTEPRTRVRLAMGLVAACALAAAGLSLSACNTVEGLGTDLQEGSQGVRDAVSDNNDD
ncbi:MAG: hypothetical protein DHS20C14_14800 [Phycisphaeraceae bacterium]|nr:MAG: hypothetical protein DHS20C14_14800 [Phycisphaeraceae bacterium]